MKLVIAVVQGSDAEDVLDALIDAGHRVTQINSAGGFLRVTNVTFLVGVDDNAVPEVAALVERNSNARKSFVNPLMPFADVSFSDGSGDDHRSVRVGASVFVLNVRRFERLTG